MASRSYDEHYWMVTEAEIMVLCRQRDSDESVAAHFGISVERVAKARSKIVKRRPYLRGLDVSNNEPVSVTNHNVEKDATEGSAQLRERVHMLFRRYGQAHGIGIDEAKVVQLYGWRILNRLKAQAA